MKKYKVKLKKDFVIGLETILQCRLEEPVTEKSEMIKLYRALLGEIDTKVYNKLGDDKKEYSFSFSPAQALALRVFCLLEAEYLDKNSYMGNRLNQVATEIHQLYV